MSEPQNPPIPESEPQEANVTGLGELSESEIALIEAHREREIERAKKMRHFEPNHVYSQPYERMNGIVVPLTNDRVALGKHAYYADCFETAWKIMGNLVYWHQVEVNFSDPDWAEFVRYFITNITEVLVEVK